MPLSKDESVLMAKLVVRALNSVKGKSIDMARACLPNDRQFEQYKSSMKSFESSVRKVLVEGMVDAKLMEPLTPQEWQELR